MYNIRTIHINVLCFDFVIRISTVAIINIPKRVGRNHKCPQSLTVRNEYTLDLHPSITDKIEKINLYSKERMQEVNHE